MSHSQDEAEKAVIDALLVEGKWPLIKVQSEEGVRELAEMTKEEVIDRWRTHVRKAKQMPLRKANEMT